ncbi:hypothetical protein ASG90_12450 [Nocardioides sp. Soil797]|nr:hypothetical protein ASG90_12450 [Nocardioides sp. Soil797]
MSDDASARFVEDLAAMLSGMGFPRMPSRVFAALLCADGPDLTARELATTLKVSPAAISGAVNFLSRIRLIHRRREAGERVDRFSIGGDMWLGPVTMEIEGYAAMVAVLDKALAEGAVSGLAADRVDETRDFFSFMTEALPRLYSEWQQSRPTAG